ncbi:MAG: class I SAM-dependent methyltransferase [Microcoleus sp. PH2017_21_RUC_O_A]|uniref:class I SAM-dependent methyltransferase n=2 Tax=unclassified Microcoleus TaxID=2642155 RepID=UPI001DA1D3A4|nr:TylF/MycF/NovP-related O-methyltransferase [Microcoleus sp. PH2017_22_RUC_O_B]MCC3529185.1 class I SAM-dependent methyltransferase [Microcoleus sp. PH2017_21_RUC_O_A]
MRTLQYSQHFILEYKLFMQIITITAADANYFELVRGTILSVREKPEGANVAIGFFDLGCTPEQLQWLETQVNIIQKPDWEFNFPGKNEAPHYLKGLLARPFLRRYFPKFDIYLWIDADAWVQDWQAVELFVKGAAKRGLAVVPELDRGYYLAYGKLPWYWEFVYRDYQAAFGEEVAKQLHSYPTINAGIFALHKDAPHWELWAQYLDEGLQWHVSLMTDQIALNRLVYGTEMFDRTEMLPAGCNWSCNFGLPVWDKQQACFVEPYLPHGAIGILHITGHKHDLVKIATTDGNQIEISLRYQPIQQPVSPQLKSVQPQSEITNNTLLPTGDYVSPGLKNILPDAYFPNMIVGDTNTCPWPYLRREIKHNWYVDRRASSVGFLSRDEAHILYNTALQFAGKKTLEIGCWLGWSACHLALAGVELDVVDPLLEREDIRQSAIDSIQGALNASGVQTSVTLIPGYSPQRVEQLAKDLNRKWSLIFIDREHEGDGPLNDAIACEKLAEEDAIILFHDLAAPAVAKGLDYLKQKGWQTVIYQTMQIMGAAWRGNVEPVKHQPDPNISWNLPAHLHGYSVSGISVKKEFTKLKLPALQQENWQTLIDSSKSSVQTFPANFKNILSIVRPYTLLSESRLFSLYCLTKQICVEDLPGNFVECGTCKGGSAALIAFVIKHYSRRPRVLYAFDTFEGMPAPTEIDKHQGIPGNLTNFGEGTLQAAISENLDKICELLQVTDIVVPVKGLFAETLPKYKPAIGSIAFLHADGDWYESTMDIFNTLYDSVIASGLIQIDDYGHWEGCKQAIHDFERMKGESFSLHTIDETGVWFQKLK